MWLSVSRKKGSQEMQAPKGQNQTGRKPGPKPRNWPECVHSQGKAGPAEQGCSLRPCDHRQTSVRADQKLPGSQQPQRSSCASSPALSASQALCFSTSENWGTPTTWDSSRDFVIHDKKAKKTKNQDYGIDDLQDHLFKSKGWSLF